jgi:hypothetical protein
MGREFHVDMGLERVRKLEVQGQKTCLERSSWIGFFDVVDNRGAGVNRLTPHVRYIFLVAHEAKWGDTRLNCRSLTGAQLDYQVSQSGLSKDMRQFHGPASGLDVASEMYCTDRIPAELHEAIVHPNVFDWHPEHTAADGLDQPLDDRGWGPLARLCQ